jgi:hypothetical protein
MKIEEMPAGEELDVLIGTKIMGLDLAVRPRHTFLHRGPAFSNDCDHCGRRWTKDADNWPCRVRPPEYSTEIEDAWLVVEAMIERRQPGSFGTYQPLLGLSEKATDGNDKTHLASTWGRTTTERALSRRLHHWPSAAPRYWRWSRSNDGLQSPSRGPRAR